MSVFLLPSLATRSSHQRTPHRQRLAPPRSSLSAMQFSRMLRGATKLPALNSKRGNKNFYKGRGAPSTGVHTPRGTYQQDPARIASLVFVAPDLTNTKLRAYVSSKTRQQSKKAKEAVERKWMQQELEAADRPRVQTLQQQGIEELLPEEDAPTEAAPFVEVVTKRQ